MTDNRILREQRGGMETCRRFSFGRAAEGKADDAWMGHPRIS